MLAAVDGSVSARRYDARHPLLHARCLLEAPCFRLLLSSSFSSYVLVVGYLAGGPSLPFLVAGCFTQGFGARRSLPLFMF